MSASQRVRGIRILKAVSSPLRLQILNLLFDKGQLSYTELMSSLKMNPSRDAGRFAYHLKFLLKANLMEVDVEARKYLLTELGKMVIDVADRIDKKAFKPKSTLVRTSRPALEEFDANKIAYSLIKEAQMPADLAQKVAKEAEKQLIRSKTKYLTAPLVREVVNGILIEKGLEEYRNKLTRLGIPVHDVIGLVESRSSSNRESASVHELAGKTIFREYALLNILPRDVSDAHLSGALHINDLDSLILKPNEISHDLRFFLEKGLDLEKVDPHEPFFQPPNNLESALALIFNVCLHTAKEIESSQILDYFNIFLSPFAADTELSKTRDALGLFLRNLAQSSHVSIGLELSVPDFLAEKPAVGPNGKRVGTYSDFIEQSQLLASLLLEVFAEENERKLLTRPSVIVKIRTETLTAERPAALLLKAHTLASEKTMLYFANCTQKERKHSVFSSSGLRLDTDPDGDWETDTLRTGRLGTVTINMPRIAYESGKDRTRFTETLRERIEMSNRALEIKQRALRHRSGKLLPFITQSTNGDQYFRMENCSRIVNLAGLRETAEVFTEQNISGEKASTFAKEVLINVPTYVQKTGRKRAKRASPAVLPSPRTSERLVQTDIERYGIAKVRFSGSREKPFYSTISRLVPVDGRLSQEDLKIESELAKACAGGNLVTLDLQETKNEPAELMAVTRQLAASHISLWTYDRKFTYCVNCRKSWPGLHRKCPVCGGVETLTYYDRFVNT